MLREQIEVRRITPVKFSQIARAIRAAVFDSCDMQASNGAAMISGESWTEFLSTKGFFVPDKWDVYWANRRVCMLWHDDACGGPLPAFFSPLFLKWIIILPCRHA